MKRNSLPVGFVARLSFGAFLATAATALAANQVHVVGPDGDFQTLQAAIDAVADGDILLVKPGTAQVVVVGDKSLTIVTDDPSDTGFHRIGNLKITGLSAGKTVVVRGFEILDSLGSLSQLLPRVWVDGCQGTVVIEDCLMSKSRTDALRVDGSAAVFVVRTIVEGGIGSSVFGTDGYPALRTTDSNVFGYDSIFEGGVGAADAELNQLSPGAPTDGGAGAIVDGGAFFASGSIISGGDGGDIVHPFTPGQVIPCIAGTGGHALVVTGGGVARRLNSPLIAGAAGTASIAGCADGVAGQPLSIDSGTELPIAEIARKLEASTPVREGEAMSLSFKGLPNEPVWLLIGFGAQGFFSSSLKGALLPQMPFTLIPFGNLGATGTLALDVGIPADVLPPGLEGVVIHEQAMFAGQSGPIVLSSPSVALLLDAGL